MLREHLITSPANILIKVGGEVYPLYPITHWLKLRESQAYKTVQVGSRL